MIKVLLQLENFTKYPKSVYLKMTYTTVYFIFIKNFHYVYTVFSLPLFIYHLRLTRSNDGIIYSRTRYRNPPTRCFFKPVCTKVRRLPFSNLSMCLFTSSLCIIFINFVTYLHVVNIK